MITRCTVRQIKIYPDTYKKIKMHCIDQNITLKMFYVKMLESFLLDVASDKSFVYLAGKRTGYRLSIYVPTGFATHIKALAELHDVSEACVINTAFNSYLLKIKI